MTATDNLIALIVLKHENTYKNKEGLSRQRGYKWNVRRINCLQLSR